MKKNLLALILLLSLTLALASCTTSTITITDPPVKRVYDEPQVKKSTSSICHERGSTYYDRTEKFTPYDSIEECLSSGGRLPKK